MVQRSVSKMTGDERKKPVLITTEDELSRVAPDQHDVRSIPRRLARKADPWADFRDHARALS